MEELIKLDAYPIRGLVGRLLQDKTTRKNILFASDSYAGYGAGYRDDSQMTEGVLLGVRYSAESIQGGSGADGAHTKTCRGLHACVDRQSDE